MQKDLTVVLFCHNRPKRAIAAIQSILQQTENNFSFLVSDNSTNKVLQEIMQADFPSIETIFWNPGHASFFDHFNEIASRIKTKYIVMFHDDDVMKPNYVDRILEQFETTPNVAAVATNASYTNHPENKTLYAGKNGKQIFTDKMDILNRFLVADFGGVAAFGSYAYNLDVIEDLHLDFSRGGRNCDTVLLMDLIDKGPIVWIDEPLIQINVEEDNISSTISVRDYKGFIATAVRETDKEINQFYIDEYRFRNLFWKLRQRQRWRIPFPALKFLLRTAFMLMIYSHSFRRRLLDRVFRRKRIGRW